MTGSKFILDTNIVVAWLNGDLSIAGKIDKAVDIYIPVIVAGELYYGALHSGQVQKNTEKITQLISLYHTLSLDEETSLFCGKIKTELRKKGKPVPENDIWIAAIALQHKLPVVTKDRHFKEINNIEIKSW